MRRRRPAAPAQRCMLLAGVVGSSTERAAELAQHPLVVGCSAGGDDDALVTVFARLASEVPDPDDARGRLLQLVVDVEQRPLTDAATLLGLSPQKAQALLDGARRHSGAPRATGRCRGWPLVAGPRTLTAAEQRAAAGHLEVCRGCRDHRAAIECARHDALARAAAVTALVGAGQLAGVAAGGGLVSAGAGSLLAGKAAAALVGVLGAAVVVGGSLTAIAQQGSGDVGRAPAVHAPTEVQPESTSSPAGVSGCAAPCAVESPAPVAADPPPVGTPEPDPVVPVPPVLQLPAGGVVLVPPTAPVVPSLPVVPSSPAVPSLPPAPSLPAASPLPSLLPLPSADPPPLAPSLP